MFLWTALLGTALGLTQLILITGLEAVRCDPLLHLHLPFSIQPMFELDTMIQRPCSDMHTVELFLLVFD